MTASPTRLRPWLWLAAGCILAAEFLVFDVMTSRHHASIYPRWSDQIQYLTEAYTSYDAYAAGGWWAGLRTAYTNPAAQGTLHDLLAVPLFALVGPSRSAALALNLLAFLAWQAALLLVLPRVSGSRALGWIAFGLLPALAAPWSAAPGSAVDFRLDHGAMCLMGVTAMVALLTQGFRSRRWSIALGVAAGITLLERFLTGAYFAPLLLAAAVWIACTGERRTRWLNLTWSGLVAALIAGPQFWINRSWIIGYYWVGHMAGDESNARAPGLDLGHSISYVLQGLTTVQLGACFLVAIAALTALLAQAAATSDSRRAAERPNADWLFFGLAFTLVPAAVLCLHRQKSEFVLGIIVPGLMLLLGWVWAWLLRRLDDGSPRTRLYPLAASLLALLAGAGYFTYRQLPSPHGQEFLDANTQVKRFADKIHALSLNPKFAEPYLGFDRISDAFDGTVLRLVCYERHHVWIPIRVMLPISILEVSDADLQDRLPRCHLFILTEQAPGHGHWPFDQQMVRLQPQLRQWCEQHMVKVEEIQFLDRRMSLYERADLL